MIPANTQIWLVAGVTDMRRGFTSLSGLVQSVLEKSPLSGQVFIFRGRRGDLLKLIWHDGDTTEIYLRIDPSQKLETVETVLPLGLRRGRFKAPEALIASLTDPVLCKAKRH
jgi:transposase